LGDQLERARAELADRAAAAAAAEAHAGRLALERAELAAALALERRIKCGSHGV
jgi:hypothetical protein